MDINGYREIGLSKIDLRLLYHFTDDRANEDHIELINFYNERVDNINIEDHDLFTLGTKLLMFINHFNHEEQLMRDYKYPLFNHHKDDHAVYIWKVKSILFNSMTDEGYYELLGFIHMWIIGHIFVVDRRLGEFLASKTS